ncbi:uncharacterized protein LOC125549237 [Triticum urartu]|uniref:Uncharacterized protein n=1 Tax=Triticum urartu TaxID=4572 RepID=A0A8R7U0A5_TRIUA|nr:uncharacterized protein LOC119273395 [Triticum dicoccoides]XP_048568653.1 uncharacterized protein LOC125549234 [Triticum urartu]XP_048568654.1 uncharacterized protein LOC125549237 [Triticum urartu]
MSSFAYEKLKKLPPPPPPASDQEDAHYAVAAAQDHYYRHAAAAIVASRRTWRSRRSSSGTGPRRRGRPLRISSLARALRRRAAAVGGRVRASVARVVTRLKEGGPCVADLFAGNYMFLQVTPSMAVPAAAGVGRGAFLPYYLAVKGKAAGAGAVHGLIRA